LRVTSVRTTTERAERAPPRPYHALLHRQRPLYGFLPHWAPLALTPPRWHRVHGSSGWCPWPSAHELPAPTDETSVNDPSATALRVLPLERPDPVTRMERLFSVGHIQSISFLTARHHAVPSRGRSRRGVIREEAARARWPERRPADTLRPASGQAYSVQKAVPATALASRHPLDLDARAVDVAVDVDAQRFSPTMTPRPRRAPPRWPSAGRRRCVAGSGVRRSRQPGAQPAVAIAAAAAVVLVLHATACAASASPRENTRCFRMRPGWLRSLDQVSDKDFRLLFCMTRDDFFALREALGGRLNVDGQMAVLFSGEGIPVDCRLAMPLRLLAGASSLDCMLAFGVGRCTVYTVFYQGSLLLPCPGRASPCCSRE